MKVIVINQEPLTVTADEAKQIMERVVSGSEVIVINGEFIRSSAIAGIRNDTSGENLPALMWGALPAGTMKHFYDERREKPGEGYAKYQALKRKLLR